MNVEAFWHPYSGAVSLTFDDGQNRRSQLDYAIPAMEKRAIKGTFFLNPVGKNWREGLTPWEAVVQRGHEIGNHTLSHTCSANFGFSPDGRGLEDMNLEEIEADILAAQERLVQVAPRQKDWTFCYPCYQAYVGKSAERRSYVPVVAKHFLAGRGGGEYGFGNHPDTIDLACVWGLDAARLSGFEMIGLAEALTATGNWVVFVLHDVAAGRLGVSMHDFELLLDFLHRQRQSIWTAPFGEVARKIADYRRRNLSTEAQRPQTE